MDNEKFNDVDENAAILNANKIDNENDNKDSKSADESENLDKSDDSDSVFQEIFKNFKK